MITVRQGVATGLQGARARREQRPELLEAGGSVLYSADLPVEARELFDVVVSGPGCRFVGEVLTPTNHRSAHPLSASPVTTPPAVMGIHGEVRHPRVGPGRG